MNIILDSKENVNMQHTAYQLIDDKVCDSGPTERLCASDC